MDFQNNVQFAYDSLDEAFPPVDPQFVPTGNRVLLQLRTAKRVTKGKVWIPDEVRDTEAANTQVARVIAVGTLAFRNRDTMEPWPEGAWFEVGDYVRCPKYGGDRWSVKTGGPDNEEAVLCLFKETDIGGKFTGDPTAVKAFL